MDTLIRRTLAILTDFPAVGVAILGHIANDAMGLLGVVGEPEAVDPAHDLLCAAQAFVPAEEHATVARRGLGRQDLGVGPRLGTAAKRVWRRNLLVYAPPYCASLMRRRENSGDVAS